HCDPLARVRGGGGGSPRASGARHRGQGDGDDRRRPARRSRPARPREAGVPAGMSSVEHAKARVVEAVEALADDLERLSLQIHAKPELCFKEEKAHGWLTEFLAKRGLRVERGVGGLPTAFRATVPGTGPGPRIAIMAEYDALPGIGHACGHNVIATAGAGAGAAPARRLATLPFPGRSQGIGTPAEEGGAGQGRVVGGGRLRDGAAG